MYGKEKQKSVIVQRRLDITDYVQSFVMHMRRTQGRVFDKRHPGEIENMKEMMNNSKNTTFKSMRDFRDGDYFWHEQRVDYVRSNLSCGYIFYFICNGCRRRARYLYEYSSLESPLCRICCHLGYEQPGRRARHISRLIRRPYLSSEAKYMLIKRAGITVEDVVSAG